MRNEKLVLRSQFEVHEVTENENVIEEAYRMVREAAEQLKKQGTILTGRKIVYDYCQLDTFHAGGYTEGYYRLGKNGPYLVSQCVEFEETD